MSEITIITNHAKRELVSLYDIPAKDRKDFDYFSGDDGYTPRLIKYKGCWYDVYDTVRIDFAREPAPHPFKGWDSYISETFFSGVLFRITDDDCVVVGRYHS